MSETFVPWSMLAWSVGDGVTVTPGIDTEPVAVPRAVDTLL